MAVLIRDVIARHRTCRAPGCTRRAEQCDIDHAIPHAAGGRTCACNLLPLCRRHHRLKTFAGWNLTLTPQPAATGEGPASSPSRDPEAPDDAEQTRTGQAAPTADWTSPTGRRYTVPPPDLPGTTHW